MRGPGQWGINMSLFRQFPIRKKVILEARVVARNLTNTPHFNLPNNNVNSSGFMTITGAAEDQRQIQLGLRLSF